MPISTTIEDVSTSEISGQEVLEDQRLIDLGLNSLRNRELAIVSLAGGVGSRWTKGAGVVKSLNPFVKMDGRHRNFVEIHLAKTEKANLSYSTKLQHVFTTSYLTNPAISTFLDGTNGRPQKPEIHISEGKLVQFYLG